jgi:hypothetical protein
VALYVHVRRLHARWSGANGWETSQALFFERWNLHP